MSKSSLPAKGSKSKNTNTTDMSKFVVPKDVKRLTAIQTGVRNRAVAQNSLIRIGGNTMLMSEACRITGLHSKVIRQKVRAGTLDLAWRGLRD